MSKPLSQMSPEEARELGASLARRLNSVPKWAWLVFVAVSLVLAGVAGEKRVQSERRAAAEAQARADAQGKGQWQADDLARLFHENEVAGLTAVRRGATVQGKVDLVRVNALGATVLEFDSRPGLAAEIPAPMAAELRSGQVVKVACSDALMVLRQVSLLRCNIT